MPVTRQTWRTDILTDSLRSLLRCPPTVPDMCTGQEHDCNNLWANGSHQITFRIFCCSLFHSRLVNAPELNACDPTDKIVTKITRFPARAVGDPHRPRDFSRPWRSAPRGPESRLVRREKSRIGRGGEGPPARREKSCWENKTKKPGRSKSKGSQLY